MDSSGVGDVLLNKYRKVGHHSIQPLHIWCQNLPSSQLSKQRCVQSGDDSLRSSLVAPVSSWFANNDSFLLA